METKREFLKKLGLLTAGGMIGGSMSPVMASKSNGNFLAPDKKIGLQIYSLGRALTEDVPNGMKKIAKFGYSTIELAGYRDGKMGNYELSDYRKIVEDAGLKITGSHVNPPIRKYSKDNSGEISEYWKKTVEDHVKLGVTTLVQPSMPAMETPDDAAFVSEVFNSNGKIAKAANIKWGYHNHHMEFGRVVKEEDKDKKSSPWAPIGEVIYDLLLNGTDPNLVFFEMDVYWAVMGQADPVEYFNKFPGRFPVLHIKDRAVLGESGMMNFAKIFEVAYKNGLNEYYVELEGMRGDEAFEGVKKCSDYLKKASFVK